jgi:hypothetical protein
MRGLEQFVHRAARPHRGQLQLAPLAAHRRRTLFEAGGEPHHYGQKTDNPAVVFGWRLAEALDWTPPS